MPCMDDFDDFDATTRQPLPTEGGADVNEALQYDLLCLRSNIDVKIPEPIMHLIQLAMAIKADLNGVPKDAAVPIHELLPEVEKDLSDRIEMGAKKYGSRLKAFNGRNVLLDWYQEVLDAIEYGKQAQMEGLIS